MRSRYCLHSWPQNVTSVIHLVSGCIIYKLQDPKILTLLVYVPNCKSLGALLAQSGSLNKCLYMLTVIMFTSAQVSILACRNLVLFLCGLTLNSKLVNRCCCVGCLLIACSACNFICRQKDYYLMNYHLSGHIWDQLVQIICHLSTGMLLVILIFFVRFLLLVPQATKMATFMAISALIFASRTLESFSMFRITTFVISIIIGVFFLICMCLLIMINLLSACGILSLCLSG